MSLDSGLPAAVARVEAAYLAHRWNASMGCQCGWEGDFEPWARHQSEIVARAAREDVAASVKEARAAELENVRLDLNRDWPAGGPVGAKHHVLVRLMNRSAAIRAGEA